VTPQAGEQRDLSLEDGVTSIAGRTLTLSVNGNSCVTGPTDACGNASCTIPLVTAPLGPQPVKAEFAGDTFYEPSSETKTAIVFAFAASGGFVLGDSTVAAAGPSTTVTFWGSKWSSLNALSGGAPPASFKGFADTTTSPPTCGGTWTTKPGNSSSPPASLPDVHGRLGRQQDDEIRKHDLRQHRSHRRRYPRPRLRPQPGPPRDRQDRHNGLLRHVTRRVRHPPSGFQAFSPGVDDSENKAAVSLR
jgi:hypothetical protein